MLQFSQYKDSDTLGVITSTLCLLHCIATPFIFIAQTQVADANAPIWWQSIDLIFISISFFAVYWSAKNSSKEWVKIGFWSAWTLLTIVILNEKINLIHLPNFLVYISGFSLAVLHIYNRKYCQCKEEKCCATAS